MNRWEYLTRAGVDRDALAELGRDGWELVSVVYDSDRSYYALFFKRPAGGV